MRLKMTPDDPDAHGPGGITTVIRKYLEYLPRYGIELIRNGEDYDVELVHAGSKNFSSPRGTNVSALHGMYWTAEMPLLSRHHYAINQHIVKSIEQSLAVTVPSEWVAETIRREFRISPFVVPHGVDVSEWVGGEDKGYVLWAKNNDRGVCSPDALNRVALTLPDVQFVSTFGAKLPNMKVKGLAFTFEEMKSAILNCSVYLATAQETFGIATLEAMAAGKPVVGFNSGFQPIVHGVTGYIARVNDIDDLAHGIRWALANRDTLGRNGRMVAAQYTWDDACQKLIEALMAAEELKTKERGVTVVIPFYNKTPNLLVDSIDSVLRQENGNDDVKVIVVDDASDTNDAETVCANYSRKRVRYIRHQKRQGVAGARNTGVDAATGEYIVCLDTDDMLAPGYIQTCLRRLAHDRSIGIVYTGLGQLMPDNTIIPSDWPTEPHFSLQAQGRNQVPTAAMFRKTMWKRAGGYRHRYTRYDRLGFGSEDAAFWLEGMTLGYQVIQETTKPLFLYRLGGSTSNREYREVKWNNFYHWQEHDYPIGTPLEPGMISRPVHIYAPPEVSIVIPVGAGHEIYLQDALDSAVSQTYKRNEIIVVWDSPQRIPSWYLSGYPFVKFIKMPKPRSGAGAARNIGVAHSTTEFIVFLDADDMLAPTFLQSCITAWSQHEAIIYTDYIGTSEIVDGQRPEEMQGYVSHDALSGLIETRNRLLEYDHDRAIIQPESQPYVWALVTCFIPKIWIQDIGGFKEDLESWEDWDFHIRLAKAGCDYFHLQEYLLHYRKFTGKRALEAQKNWKEWALPSRMG